MKKFIPALAISALALFAAPAAMADDAQAITKKVLVEEFTTMSCGNCPRVAGYLHTVLGEEEFKDNVVAVCHHSGYGTDALTQLCDNRLLRLYGSGGTYAPGMMFDRQPYFSNSCVTCPTLADIRKYIRKAMEEECKISVKVSTVYDEANKEVTVTVTGKDLGLDFSNPLLTVYITEDNVGGYSQAGANSTFQHQHVIRAYNAIWGDMIGFNEDGEFTEQYKFTIDDKWKKDDLKAVAFIDNYNASNIAYCQVANADACDLFPSEENGISEAVADATPVSARWYTLDGVEVSGREAKGMLIKVTTLANGKTRTEKILK